jgi:putative hydrolase of the HAD superfamily
MTPTLRLCPDRFPGIQAVSFDVGGTLIEPWPSVGEVYAQVAAQSGLPRFDAVRLNDQFKTAWRAKTNFDYSRDAWASLVARTFGGPADQFGVNSPFFERLYRRFMEADVWRVHDDAVPALQALCKAGLKLAVISNWDDRLRPLLRNLKLDGFFQAIEVSGECGYHKPAPEIFLRAGRSLNVPVADVLHVGDNLLEDVQGARRAGLHAVLLRRQLPRAADEIGSLLQLLA